ncbi:MAG TPA: hypothetical protein P5186_18930 [Candidatus Paceibacterota bacterium]|nr:hypothetical protein [Verrucomicrobiota bacterium]HRY50130.1 hypothetical protein [Candidatus Paceibacterota bacterium]HRZ57182.1 hypothetical protein [Candidatus Paceibacterota bacterium]
MKTSIHCNAFAIVVTIIWALSGLPCPSQAGEIASIEQRTSTAQVPDLWRLAQQRKSVHRLSTLLMAQQVHQHLSSDEGINACIDWCRETAVTKVYLETFRGGFRADANFLKHAAAQFRKAGIEVSGCVTTTHVGKPCEAWKEISCYTDLPTQEKLQAIFEYTAGLFDEIMIDDYWFTVCECADCSAARIARTVKVGEKTFRVPGDSWADYRCELMLQVSRHCILAAARRVNPKVKVIIKYPQWYDEFHVRGYDVVRQAADFDRTWVGTELRDYGGTWGKTPQYEGFFIMRWLGGIGGSKCGGGWYDPYGTTEHTDLEQARQTILGGARESMLFCYGALLEETGPKNVETLRANIPELFEVAEQVRRRPITGIAAYKPANSDAETGRGKSVSGWLFDFVGMLGLPLALCHEFPTNASAAFFSTHALKDPLFVEKLTVFVASERPVLITDALASRLEGNSLLKQKNVKVLPVPGNPESLLDMPQDELDALRATLLAPLHRSFRAPARVALYLFKDGSWVVENFRNESVRIEVDGIRHAIAGRGWHLNWK